MFRRTVVTYRDFLPREAALTGWVEGFNALTIKVGGIRAGHKAQDVFINSETLFRDSLRGAVLHLRGGARNKNILYRACAPEKASQREPRGHRLI